MINRKALKKCLGGSILIRSLTVAIVIGTLLNAINQGDVVLAGQVPNLAKLALTYLVPFLVATYGAYSALASIPDQ